MINNWVKYLVFLFLPIVGNNLSFKSDTVKISATGVNNQVAINGQQIKVDSVIIDTTNITGQISQTGKSNQIEINASNNYKADSTRTRVTIKQIGNYNTVKINSK